MKSQLEKSNNCAEYILYMESLEFVMAQFSRYLQNFTSSTKTIYIRFSYPTETRRIHRITFPQKSKIPTLHKNWPPQNRMIPQYYPIKNTQAGLYMFKLIPSFLDFCINDASSIFKCEYKQLKNDYF